MFSPASIHIALGMTYAGARGATADEMARTLRYGATVHDQFRVLLASLAKLEHKDQSFRMANRLFAHAKYDWSKSFLALTDKNYSAALEPVDFGNPEPVRKHINTWVEDQTNKKIKDLLPKGSLTSDSRMVLTNAVYFRRVAAPVRQVRDRARDFAVRGTSATKVPTMQTADRFGLGRNADATVLEMPYSHGDIVMNIILPRDKNGLAAVEGKLADGLGKLLPTVKTDRSVAAGGRSPRFREGHLPARDAQALSRPRLQGSGEARTALHRPKIPPGPSRSTRHRGHRGDRRR